MAKKQDYYAVLGIRRDASPEEVRQAYFMAARRLHPDKNIAPGETEMFKRLMKSFPI
jgi:DnaJ-class molecular chaperone